MYNGVDLTGKSSLLPLAIRSLGAGAKAGGGEHSVAFSSYISLRNANIKKRAAARLGFLGVEHAPGRRCA